MIHVVGIHLFLDPCYVTHINVDFFLFLFFLFLLIPKTEHGPSTRSTGQPSRIEQAVNMVVVQVACVVKLTNNVLNRCVLQCVYKKHGIVKLKYQEDPLV